MFKEFKSGFVPVCFIDFWFADQLNSLALVFLDIEFFFCFYIKEQENALEVSEPIEVISTIGLNFVTSDNNDSTLNDTPIQNTTQFMTTTLGMNSSEDIDDGPQCGTYDYGVRYFVAVLPAYFRLAQCFRRAKDSKDTAEKYSRMSKDYKKHIGKMKHHLANAGKYTTSFIKGKKTAKLFSSEKTDIRCYSTL